MSPSPEISASQSMDTLMSEIVEKVWGREIWLVNNEKYCYKRLFLSPGFQCSLHYHPVKQETFIVESGWVMLEHNGEEFLLGPGMQRTILPGEPHRFRPHGDDPVERVILEVSTMHRDSDVVRLEPSRAL